MRGPARFRRLVQGSERGSALLMALALVMVMTLLGVALFEMSVIEASLARSDALDIQAFYCAEAQAARLYGLYAPAEDPSGTRSSEALAATSLPLANGAYALSGSARVDAATQVVTVTATCALPDGRTRTVQRSGARQYFSSPGLPGGVGIYLALPAGSWKDCGGNPLCP